MTLNQVKRRVEEIEKCSGDSEKAHCMEDELYRFLVMAIARGKCQDPQKCCEEALKTMEMDFSRWCS